MLGLTKLAVRIVSFKRIAPYLGDPRGASCLIPILTREQAVRARLVARVIKQAAQFTPWDSNCYPKAFTAALLLRFYGIPYAFFFGMKRDRDSKSFKAHAWTTAGQVKVVGGAGFDEYTVVGCFTSGLNGIKSMDQS